MLWSLFKILLFVAVVVALAFGAQWLLAQTGEVLITFRGDEFTLSPILVVLGAVVLLAALWLLFLLAGFLLSVLRFVNGDDTAVSRYFARNRERRGYEALSDSIIALASGEAREATTKAQAAEKYLGRPEVTDVVVAQAAEAAGDRDRAMEAYKRLVRNDRTRFVGVRGLMRQKLEEGDTDTGMKLAEKAFALKPRHVETQDTLLRLQAKEEDWEGARRVLMAKLKSGSLPKDVYKRREAVLSLADARARLAEGKADAARAEALEANRLSPELVPAAVLASRMHIEAGEARRAAKVLRTAWQKTHHPDLAAAFADIEPAETPAARIKRFGSLLKLDPRGARGADARDRAAPRGRGLPGGAPRARLARREPSDDAEPVAHGRDRARRGGLGGGRAWLAGEGARRKSGTAMGLRELRHHPRDVGARLHVLRGVRHVVVVRAPALGGAGLGRCPPRSCRSSSARRGATRRPSRSSPCRPTTALRTGRRRARRRRGPRRSAT